MPIVPWDLEVIGEVWRSIYGGASRGLRELELFQGARRAAGLGACVSGGGSFVPWVIAARFSSTVHFLLELPVWADSQ